MTRLELIRWLLEDKTKTKDPKVEFWADSWNQFEILSIYASENNKKIFIDIQLKKEKNK